MSETDTRRESEQNNHQVTQRPWVVLISNHVIFSFYLNLTSRFGHVLATRRNNLLRWTLSRFKETGSCPRPGLRYNPPLGGASSCVTTGSCPRWCFRCESCSGGGWSCVVTGCVFGFFVIGCNPPLGTAWSLTGFGLACSLWGWWSFLLLKRELRFDFRYRLRFSELW